MMKSILRSAAIGALCLPVVAAADDARVFQAAEINGADGAVWLKRTEDSVDGRVMAKVAMADSPYTVWWVIFNQPENCLSSPCGQDLNGNGTPDDLEDGGAAADVAVFNAGGAISAASGALKNNGKPDGTGVINLNISMLAGESAGNGAQMGFPAPFFTRDLEDGLTAEIHVLIDKHVFDTDWVFELTYPEQTEAFAILLPVGE